MNNKNFTYNQTTLNMKKITLIVILFIAQSNFAQNTFPTTGRAGVGTLSPSSNLHVYATDSPTSNLMGQIQVGGSYNTLNDIFLSIGTNKTGEYAFIGAAKGGIGYIPLITSKLEVKGTIKSYEDIAMGATFNSAKLINETGGNVGENSFFNRIWLYRDLTLNNWYSARLHDGISIDASFNTPQLDTKTWWERDPFDNIQSWGTAADTYLTINKGNVGIGTIVPDEKLTVKGKIHTQEVRVDMLGPLVPDYVFAEDYKLKSLREIEEFIKENKHLPEVPSANEIEKNGLMLAEMNMALLKKIEEMTLYIIEMKKENEEMKEINKKQDEKIMLIENKLSIK